MMRCHFPLRVFETTLVNPPIPPIAYFTVGLIHVGTSIGLGEHTDPMLR